jgi:hypothetical protein
LLAVAGDRGELAQRQLRGSEVGADHVAADLVDKIGEGGIFVGESALQGTRVHGELCGDRFQGGSSGRQHAANHSAYWFAEFVAVRGCDAAQISLDDRVNLAVRR